MACRIDGCRKKPYGHGWCVAHYWRWRRHGDPLAGNVPRGALLDWLSRQVNRDTDACIEWPFKSKTTGYGTLWYRGKRRLAHHVALALSGRPLPGPGEQCRHLCGNRSCVNLRHVEVGTQAENEADKILHGRSNHGERCGGSKLSREDVLTIRQSNRTHLDLAEEYDVARQTVTDIKQRRTWSWLP